MIPVVILVALVGAVFGLRFKVFVLAPAAAALVVITVAGKFLLAPQVSAVLVSIVLIASLQFGYLGGLFVRRAIAAARLPVPRLEPKRAKVRA